MNLLLWLLLCFYGQLPEPHGLVVAAGKGRAPVRRDRDGLNPARVSLERMQSLSRRYVPKPELSRGPITGDISHRHTSRDGIAMPAPTKGGRLLVVVRRFQ